MHIKLAETGPSGSGRTNDGVTTRKLRLGGATRVPIHGHAKATDSPLRVLVSAIGQTLGTRTPLRKQSSAGSSVARSILSSSKSSTAVAADSRSTSTSSSSEGRMNTNHSSTAKIGAPAVPATPITPKGRVPVKTPSRRSSLSSSSSSISSSSSTAKNVTSAPSTRKSTATSAKTSGKLDPVTPVTKRSSIPRTPNALKNSATPTSSGACIPLPTPRRKSLSSTPGPKQISTPGQTRSKSIFPTTPVSKSTAACPSTPVNGENTFSTPHASHGSNPAPFYTPQSSLPPTPLQPRNHNASDSSRKLHFGINVAALAEQENMGSRTPKAHTPGTSDATFSFDRNRLAQIKARRNAAQLLKSPAQRVRVPDFQSTGRVLQQLAEDRSTRFDEEEVRQCLSKTPAKRRVANSLF